MESLFLLSNSPDNYYHLQCQPTNSATGSIWTLSEAATAHHPKFKLPIKQFNHVAREVADLQKSKHFYCHVLRFDEIPRPPISVTGCWLHGYGLNLHLTQSDYPDQRKEVHEKRIEHFTQTIPNVAS